MGVVVLKILLSLAFLLFTALVLSLISRTNSLSRQAARLLKALKNAEDMEKSLSAVISTTSKIAKT